MTTGPDGERGHVELRRYDEADRQAVLELSLRAWEPVFESLRGVLGPSGVFDVLHPDWRDSQRRAVEGVLDDPATTVWSAVLDGMVIGFAAATVREAYGEIVMLAVDPSAQRRGIGGALTTTALAWIAEQGVAVAMVETGGDPGHAPARRVYERAGFAALPVTRYFRRSASPPPRPARSP
ncbi:GNAT family N-acetyltransferase [Actinomycetospora endophytica]|uniref:GNAT family N-acetyltransferase n=1 Tax=Actinomycetospora endophytica TaxID=2291215 RepID=A0ABS8PCQ5_9PSEU|nr:GNAT family N-acetyltransferase [Actinomycetospora endophytica]MCD2195682.1 GNAT family N-acetyltransferase [Actinomycetospora endophytica]